MKMQIVRSLVTLIAVTSLVACGGGGGKNGTRTSKHKGSTSQTKPTVDNNKTTTQKDGQPQTTVTTKKPETEAAKPTPATYQPRIPSERTTGTTPFSTSAEKSNSPSSSPAPTPAPVKENSFTAAEVRAAMGNQATSISDTRTSGNTFSAADVRNATTPALKEPPGLAKGYDIPSTGALVTGALDDRGQPYTDIGNDSIMAALVAKMNAQDPKFREDSQAMAHAVSYVKLEEQNGVLNLDLGLELEGKDLLVPFTGTLVSNKAKLAPRLSTDGNRFEAEVICTDGSSDCRSAVIVVDLFVAGNHCRRMYISHRWLRNGVGDGHFTISDDDYANWSQAKNPAQKGFLRLLANTAHYNKVMFNEIPRENVRSPRLGYLGVRSWAVAYGRSQFEIKMEKIKTTSNRPYKVTFFGPLTMPNVPGQVSQELNLREDQTTVADAEKTGDINEQLAGNVGQILLTGNDGRGNLALQVHFYGPKDINGKKVLGGTNAITLINFTKLRMANLPLSQLIQVIP
jgi:hypothetical protein